MWLSRNADAYSSSPRSRSHSGMFTGVSSIRPPAFFGSRPQSIAI